MSDIREERSQCESHFLMHDQAIKNNSEAIARIDGLMTGLPEKLENVIKQIEKLCYTIEKSDEKYVSKEVFILVKKGLEDKIKILYAILGSIGGALAGYIVAHLMGKI